PETDRINDKTKNEGKRNHFTSSQEYCLIWGAVSKLFIFVSTLEPGIISYYDINDQLRLWSNRSCLVASHNWNFMVLLVRYVIPITPNVHETIARPIGLSAPGRVSLPSARFFEVQRTRGIGNGATAAATSSAAGHQRHAGSTGYHWHLGRTARHPTQ